MSSHVTFKWCHPLFCRVLSSETSSLLLKVSCSLEHNCTHKTVTMHTCCVLAFTIISVTIVKCFIACFQYVYFPLPHKGPLPNTLVDFWRLVWQERPSIIVMLTNVMEKNKIKCQQYWPDSGSVSYGPFTVTITDQQVLANYTVRNLQLAVSTLIA